MFAAYPVTLIPLLVVLGNLSDHLAELSAIAAGAAALGAVQDPVGSSPAGR